MWACSLDRMNCTGMINTKASCGRFADYTYFLSGREDLVVLHGAERGQKEARRMCMLPCPLYITPTV